MSTGNLAIEVHQFPGPNPDLAFGLRLKVRAGGPGLARTVLINEVFPGPQGVNFIEFFNSGGTPVNLKGHFLLSAVLLRRLPGAAPATTIAPAVAGPSARPTLRADMRDGLRHFAANRLVRVITFMVATWSFGQR